MTVPISPVRPGYDLCGEAHDYASWSGPPRRTILICSQPRSGSTMLGEALYFAGGLGCALEYLHTGFRPGFEARWGVAGLDALTREVRRHRTDPSGTLAVKLFWQDVADLVDEAMPGAVPDLRSVPARAVPVEAYRAVGALLGDRFPHPVHVHLERRDRLREAVSLLSATQTGAWRRIPATDGRPDAGSSTPDAVIYDPDAIGRIINGIVFCHDHWRAYFRANGIDAYAMTYEELAADHADTVGRLLRRLGHPGPVPAPRMERQAAVGSEALIRRFLRDRQVAARR